MSEEIDGANAPDTTPPDAPATLVELRRRRRSVRYLNPISRMFAWSADAIPRVRVWYP